jgi:6,7-dimethyl-8-ribityllumazine synthase
MDQSIKANFQLLNEGKKIAFIQAGWHKDIVGQAFAAFVEECSTSGISNAQIKLFEVPGSLEIPLQAKILANSHEYAVIVAAGLVVDGGIYRHDFVAGTVIDAMMQVQLETEIPILSVVLTPHNFQETEAHESFFYDHFKIKGTEAAHACLQTLKNLGAIQAA